MLLAIAVAFVGSQACRPCHASIADAYAQTPMARSSGRVDSLAPVSFNAAGHKYSIAGKRLAFDGGSASIDYFIGSGASGKTYLREWDGYLFELPVSWYTNKRIWDASPGYEKSAEILLTRPVESSCLLCHASRVRPVLGTQNRYGNPAFLDNGVTCERCHGAGGDHVRNPAQSPMVNPAKLEPERRDSVCSQCHLSGEARIENPGRRFADFRAGDRLADFATYFVWSLGRRDLKVTSHVEKLAGSACKVASGDRLWCGTCHEPHTNADRTQQACLGCHGTAHAADERKQQRCAGCHMPRTKAVDANHGVMTDHSISRVPKAPEPPAHDNLKAFLGSPDDRSVGLAWAELGDPRAQPFLERARPSDWPVRLRLAFWEKDPARAIALYESVLRDNPAEPAALVNLGTLRAQSGNTEEAGRLWERALVVNPAIEQAVLNLCQIRARKDAEAILKRYLEVNPTSPAALARLASVQK